MKKLFLAALAALFLAAEAAHAMPVDLSKTRCARAAETRSFKDRQTYFAWVKKCHARRGTQPRWGLQGNL